MNIHEYQAKELLAEFGVPVAARACRVLASRRRSRPRSELAGPLWVVKAQIHAGGRGKGRSASRAVQGRSTDVREGAPPRHARQDAGHAPDRPARQAGQARSTSRTAPTSRASSISRCWSTARPARVAFVVSTEGGMDIEEVAHDTPEKIVTVHRRSGDRLHAASRPRGRRRRSASTGDLAKQAAALVAQALRRLRRHGHEPARDQPAGRHQGRPAASASTPRSASTTTRCSAIPTSRRCAT